MTSVRERAAELAARPGYATVLLAVRERLERGGDPAAITLRDLDVDARHALADLLGRSKLPQPTARVRVADLDEALRTSRVGTGLRPVLEALGGPLRDLRAERADSAGTWARVWESAGELLGPRDDLRTWLEGLRATGLVRKLSADVTAAEALLEQAIGVATRLPARGVGLPVLAAEATGDAHALDPGQPLATLVLRAAALLPGYEAVPASARQRRQLWADVGVVCDQLSVSVLVLGVALDGGGAVADACRVHAEAGEPLRLTLRQLIGAKPLRVSHPTVHVCENPAVVAAAADACAGAAPRRPLVCTEGIPDVAADQLLSAVSRSGTRVAFHADFDWGGIRIGNVLSARYRTVPWRFGASDYEHVLERGPITRPLRGTGTAASWDPLLAPSLRRNAIAVSEEQLLVDLLDDFV